MTSRLSFILAIFIILLSSTVSAFLISNDNTNSLYLCPKETGFFSFNITGTSNEQVNITTSDSSWTTASSQNLVLKQGESQLLTIYVTPDSKAGQGSYSLDINLNDNKINKKIVIKDCFKSDLSALPKTQSVCPGEFAKYQFTIFNLGSHEDTFKLESNGINNIKLSEKVFALAPGKSRTVYAYLTAPKQDGNYDFHVTAENSNGNTKTIDASLTVNPCYDYSVKFDKTSYNICEHSTLIIPITIKNSATITNTFRSELDSPSWTTLTKTSLTMPINIENTFYILASPDYNELGNYTIDLKTTPYYGALVAHNKINITVRKCHDASLKIKQDYYELCHGEQIIQTANLTNLGEFSKTFFIGKTNYDWVNLNTTNSVKLNPLETKQFSMLIKPNENTTAKEYELGIGIEAADDSGISQEQKFKVLVLPKERCFLTKVETSNININLFYNKTKTIYIDLGNKGVYNEQYVLSLQGSAASFSNLSAKTISIIPNKTSEFSIIIKPVKSVQGLKDLTLKIYAQKADQAITKTFTFNITNNSNDLGQEVIEETSWNKITSFLSSIFIVESSQETPTLLSRLEDYKYHVLVLIIIIILVILLVLKLVSLKKKKVRSYEPRIRITKKKN